ncbi:MAG: hypothetical protein ACKOAD_07860, partial [Gammaproteobacteria bacterium]
KNGAILWKRNIHVEQEIDGKWDEPPYYPNFTNHLNSSIRKAQQDLLNDFFNTSPAVRVVQ